MQAFQRVICNISNDLYEINKKTKMKKTIFIFFLLLLANTTEAIVSKSVTVFTAGTLGTVCLNAADKSTVTNLTVIGYIDASDIDCMRDEMPLLAELNINAVIIKASGGHSGTYGYYYSFPENEMPKLSFYGKTSLTSITMPNSINSIGIQAFLGCSGLTNITIPNSVISVGSEAFRLCSGLNSVIIGNAATSIGQLAFQNCSSLTNLTLDDNLATIGSAAFYGCNKLVNLTIPNLVTSIGNSAFQNCTGLNNVIIGNGVTSIGDFAFHGCSSLTSLSIGNGVSTIGTNAFEFCSGLTSILIPDAVTSIGAFSFQFCSGVNSLTIGNNVTTIGEAAFANCSGITNIISRNPLTPTLGINAFLGITSTSDVYVPTDDAVISYKANANWFGFFPGTIIKKLFTTESFEIPKSNLKAYSTNLEIILEGTSDCEKVELYSAGGMILKTIMSQGDKIVITVKLRGVYLIKTQSKTIKVIV